MKCPECGYSRLDVSRVVQTLKRCTRTLACPQCLQGFESEETIVGRLGPIDPATGDAPVAHRRHTRGSPVRTGTPPLRTGSARGVGGGLSGDPVPDPDLGPNSVSDPGFSGRSDPPAPARSLGVVGGPSRETIEKIHACEWDRLPYPMACVTPAFEEVYEAYPRGHARNEAAKVFHYLAMVEGGERALADKILVAFQRGLLMQAPYAGPNATCPMLTTFLERRSWNDKIGGARPPKRSALGEMPD